MSNNKGLSRYGIIGGIVLIGLFLANGYEISEFSFWGFTFNKKSEPALVEPQPLVPQPTQQPVQQPTQAPVIQQPVQPQTTAVTIAYSGDYYGCQLPLNMQIGGVSFVHRAITIRLPGYLSGCSTMRYQARSCVRLLVRARQVGRDRSIYNPIKRISWPGKIPRMADALWYYPRDFN